MAFFSEDSVGANMRAQGDHGGHGFCLPFCVLYILQCSLIYEKYNFLGIFLSFSAFRILNKD